MKKRFITAGAIALMVSFSLLTGCMPTEEATLMPQLSDPAQITYQTEAVTKGDVEFDISGTGSIASKNTRTISFAVAGTVLSNNIGSMMAVKQGQVLATLSGSDILKQQLAMAQITADKDSINLKNAQIAKNGGGNVALLKLYWQQEENVLAQTSKSNSLAYQAEQIKVEITKAAYDNAVSAANDNYQIANDTYQADLTNISNLQKQINDCSLVAPIAGIVTWVDPNFTVGAQVKALSDVVTISQASPLMLTYAGDAKDEPYLKMGTVVQLVYKNQTYNAQVTMDPSNTPANAHYGSEFMWSFAVNGLDLTHANIGDMASFKIVIAKHTNVMKIDSYLITTDSKGNSTVKVLDNGLPTTKQVQIGISSATETEIISGLSVGDKVVIS